jgi:hypothetical protein
MMVSVLIFEHTSSYFRDQAQRDLLLHSVFILIILSPLSDPLLDQNGPSILSDSKFVILTNHGSFFYRNFWNFLRYGFFEQKLKFGNLNFVRTRPNLHLLLDYKSEIDSKFLTLWNEIEQMKLFLKT